MSGIRTVRKLARDESGEAMVSFGFILPILVMITFGVLDFGIVMFEYGRAAEATRRGARIAAVTDSIANLDAIGTADVICTGSAGSVSCGGVAVINAAGFDTIVNDMRTINPRITPENVQLTYRHSGLGLAAAGGVKPFVSVALVNYRQPLTLLAALPGLPGEITLPDFATTEILKFYESPP